MIHTRICDLLGITHPIVLGGMGAATTAPLVAAVSIAGGFGTLGTSAFNAATLDTEIAAIHERTDKPFGVNHLLFQIQEDMFAVTLRRDQRSRPLHGRARIRTCAITLSGLTMSAARSCTWRAKFPKLSAPPKPVLTCSSRKGRKPADMWVGWLRCRWCR
jgi:NAD(P)H-dependent flavin oxidoreductase YrpB (nitropropane dioxygenase family)